MALPRSIASLQVAGAEARQQQQAAKAASSRGGCGFAPVAINGQHGALTQVVTAVPCSRVADKVRFIFR